MTDRTKTKFRILHLVYYTDKTIPHMFSKKCHNQIWKLADQSFLFPMKHSEKMEEKESN
jgi:hypothetical protein